MKKMAIVLSFIMFATALSTCHEVVKEKEDTIEQTVQYVYNRLQGWWPKWLPIKKRISMILQKEDATGKTFCFNHTTTPKAAADALGKALHREKLNTNDVYNALVGIIKACSEETAHNKFCPDALAILSYHNSAESQPSIKSALYYKLSWCVICFSEKVKEEHNKQLQNKG